MTEANRINRCAIYTRKSSEEGLEQSFNSLDAQRESCAAFISSQKREGWRVLPTAYDDGGYSGGTLERPALKQLLQDVEQHKLDTIVVYKVDRLTRSLPDFAKIVEILDAHGVSFVSVTQQFNTTTSMGRLTLNILLSFAQFEREVTGERIRDKIAASKRKGMWMGGVTPLGYDCQAGKLTVNCEEAERVRLIFRTYLELKCVRKLRERLIESEIRSKIHISKTGNRLGGVYYSRGALYQLLKNPIYVGDIKHREQRYRGEHEAIVSAELWDAVQTQLKSTHQGRRTGLGIGSASWLTSLLYDQHGNRFTPTHTLRRGKRYRYYFCPASANEEDPEARAIRLPAGDIEHLVVRRLQAFLSSATDLMDHIANSDDAAIVQKTVNAGSKLSKQLLLVSSDELRQLLTKVIRRVVVQPKCIELLIRKSTLRQILTSDDKHLEHETTHADSRSSESDIFRLEAQTEIRRHGIVVRLVAASCSGTTASSPASSLLKAIARASAWSTRLLDKAAKSQADLARQLGMNHRYVDKVLQCAFLAPDIVEAILDGRQPPDLSFTKLIANLPLDWAQQRAQLGFSSKPN
jgi:site-specific DNA recombinase